MKALLGIVSGFMLTLVVFGSGLAFATWLLAAKPVRQMTPAIGVSELWTKDARPIDPDQQQLERIPAKQGPSATIDGTADVKTASIVAPADAGTMPATDGKTATMSSTERPPQQASVELPAAHVEWCENRYRSYRPEENNYRSYSGELRPCISPYLDAAASTEARQIDLPGVTDDQAETNGYATDGYATTYGLPDEAGPDELAGGEDQQLSADHVDSCFSRYRSYRPEDNSYQPYDGGPRRQCE